ncbi:MAG: hypothetical protein ACI3VR_00645 [Intestinibacter sp.]|uniref:hypothetical protein n=1 Tax=Intestinibacter sp. TaxID=1965304 RepID=UPI003F140BEC
MEKNKDKLSSLYLKLEQDQRIVRVLIGPIYYFIYSNDFEKDELENLKRKNLGQINDYLSYETSHYVVYSIDILKRDYFELYRCNKDLYEDIYRIAYQKSSIYRKVCALKDDNEVINNLKQLIFMFIREDIDDSEKKTYFDDIIKQLSYEDDERINNSIDVIKNKYGVLYNLNPRIFDKIKKLPFDNKLKKRLDSNNIDKDKNSIKKSQNDKKQDIKLPDSEKKVQKKPVQNNKNKKKQNQNKPSKNFKVIGMILAFVIVFLAGFGLAKNYFGKDDNGQVLNTNYSSEQNDDQYNSNSSEDEENQYYEEELVKEDSEDAYTDDDAISQSQITEVIDNLEYNYDEAINTGNVVLVYPYITETGNLRKNYDKYIPKWHEEGLRTYIKDADYGQFEYEDGEYRISRVSVNKVVQNNKAHYEKEYIEFVLVENDDLELLVDRCENYSMLDSDYDYSE